MSNEKQHFQGLQLILIFQKIMQEACNFMEAIECEVEASKALNSIPSFKMELLRNPDSVVDSVFSKFLGCKNRNLLVK